MITYQKRNWFGHVYKTIGISSTTVDLILADDNRFLVSCHEVNTLLESAAKMYLTIRPGSP